MAFGFSALALAVDTQQAAARRQMNRLGKQLWSRYRCHDLGIRENLADPIHNREFISNILLDIATNADANSISTFQASRPPSPSLTPPQSLITPARRALDAQNDIDDFILQE